MNHESDRPPTEHAGKPWTRMHAVATRPGCKPRFVATGNLHDGQGQRILWAETAPTIGGSPSEAYSRNFDAIDWSR